jgi:site-specific DNA-methyltransferase (adenine-specific)
LVTPYYADDLVTIYHGDWRGWQIPGLVDAVVTDPPYGIGWQQQGGGNGKTRGSRRHDGIRGDESTAERDEMLAIYATVPAAVFGSWRAVFPARLKQVLVYQKSPDAGLMGSVTGFRTDCDPIFLVGPWPRRTVRWSSVLRSAIGLQTLQAGASHPHAKPVDVLSRLIEATEGTVLDPFMGSGTTLVAAKSLGRRAIGIEIEERYCEIAAQRCSQEVLGLETA